jgi:hypothetical protein
MITLFIYIAVGACILFGLYVLINLILNFESLKNK